MTDAHHGKRTNGNRFVDWAEYNSLSDEERQHVTVVTFTGLTDCGTLRESASALDDKGTLGSGGREKSPPPPQAS